MGAKLSTEMTEAELRELVPDSWISVLRFFSGNSTKTLTWFNSRNPNLGDISPVEMIRLNHTQKLERWIKLQIEV